MIKILFDVTLGQYILVNFFKGEQDLIYTCKKENRVRELYNIINKRLDKENEKWIDSILLGIEEHVVNEYLICVEELRNFN